MTQENNQTHEVGDLMEDGTVLGGYHKGKALYVTPQDAAGSDAYSFDAALAYAKKLDAYGHHDFRVPDKGELNVLWENRNKGLLKGTFNESGANPQGVYWSSSVNPIGYGHFVWGQDFSDGHQDYANTRLPGRESPLRASLRCVR